MSRFNEQILQFFQQLNQIISTTQSYANIKLKNINEFNTHNYSNNIACNIYLLAADISLLYYDLYVW